MKKYSIFILVFFLSVATADAATIRISDPKVQLELEPGQTYSGELSAENASPDSVEVKMYLEDWVYTPGGNGQKTFTPSPTALLSAGEWIHFSPSKSTIQPYGRLVVRYTIQVPKDAKGGHYSVLFFETVIGNTVNEEGVDVLVSGRVGALFYIEAKGTVERTGKIESVDIQVPQGNRPYEIVTQFRNTGNVDITLEGKYLIMDGQGLVKARGNLSSIYTFPGDVESAKTEWVGRLPKGNYQALLTYDLGKGEALVEERALIVS